MKAIAEPNRIEAEKRRKKRIKISMVVGVLVIAFVAIWGYIWYSTQPLDRILDYRVSVTPQPDGTLEITYNIRWEVLNDSREGPLTWVKIGMANEEFEIVEYGGDIAKPLGYPNLIGSLDPYYAEFELDRAYYKGEIADFWFTVRQRRMLCGESSDSTYVFYDFTPGWFNSIEIEHYLFTWYDRIGALSANADSQKKR